MQRKDHHHLQKKRDLWQMFGALLVGLGTGLIAVAFQQALHVAEHWRVSLVAWMTGKHHLLPWLYPVLAGLIVGVVGWATRTWCPQAAGSGIPHLKGVLQNIRALPWKRLLPVKFLGGVFAIGAGLSLGREGPTVQMGGAVGGMVSRALSVSPRVRKTLIAVGSGAGLSGAFNAPLSGFVFIMEELYHEFSFLHYGPALIATLTAAYMTRSWTGQLPAFAAFTHQSVDLSLVPLFLGFGLAAGIGGVIFKWLLLRGVQVMGKQERVPKWLVPVLIGAAVGVVVLLMPEAVGGGHGTAEKVLNGGIPLYKGLGYVSLLLGLKVLLTLCSYLAGVPGGIFAPMLLMGSLLGLAFGFAGHALLPGLGMKPEVFAVVGMTAFFAAVTHAPLTGAILILEMTGNFKLLYPMLIAGGAAYFLSEWLGERPVYDALLDEDIRKGGVPPIFSDEPETLEIVIERGSEIEERLIRNLHFPEGVLITAVHRGGRTIIPSGNMLLQAGDTLECTIAGDIALLSLEIRQLAHKPAPLPAE